MFTARKNELSFERNVKRDMERHHSYTVVIHVKNTSNYPIRLRLIDDLSQTFLRPFPIQAIVGKGESKKITYETMALKRGDFTLRNLYVRYASMLGLWEKQLKVAKEDCVRVIPNITDVKSYLQDAQRFLLYEGIHIRKHQAGMGEFSSIRHYVVGDDPRMINWHQTAKLQEVMINEYEPEHGKYITILIDSGRMMGVELSNGNRLERSLEAALTVIAAALKKGDYVAVVAFSKQVNLYIPPEKGMDHLQTILHALYNIEVEPVESNYREAFHYISKTLKKRSLFLLFSDVQTFLYDESLLTYFMHIRERHLLFMIGIEDEVLIQRAQQYPEDANHAMIKSMAQHQLLTKQRKKVKWQNQGLYLIEAKEEDLSAVAVSYYIDMMNRGLL